MKTDDIRKAFLEFFKSKGHEIVASDSLVPKDDPTLLFTGAGMNQFKEKFLGRNITYKRAGTCQKCLRTGDLENVGKTPSHHTFFEMLGNFSFGDYFKREAIGWAWEFLTGNLKLKTDNLWVSVYKDDDEAYKIWKDIIKIPEKKIIKFGAKENFWPSEAPAKGPNGPCGPCSEIFYDYSGSSVEIWNLVFTQFDRQADGVLKPLPNKNIDTGMGLERLASVMQGVKTNFEIDIFRPIVEAVKKELGVGSWESGVNAIADHIRAVTFMIADGVMPSNEERGYVVRKLIRRAMMHGQDIGRKDEPFLYRIVGVVAEAMQAHYPDVKAKRDDIAQVVKREEENFLFVINSQIPKVEEAFEKIRDKKQDTGDKDKLEKIAFNFYDTYGMPYDMLEDIALKFKLKIDKKKFEGLLDKQRDLSRSKTKIKGEIFTETFAKKVEAIGFSTDFLGYEKSNAEAKVLAVLEGGEVILDKTPFYGESGGQVGDWGRIDTPSGSMEVEDAKKIGNTIVHIGKMLKGRIVKGETAKVSINEDARKKVMANHTAAHLLQAALRKVLGEHVRQTGSLVDQDRLRFDFTHMKKMDAREIARVEEIVNEYIKEAIAVKSRIKDIESARREGATALFDEKYGDKVRVVSIGDVSKELCGGTHVNNTSTVGIFKVIRESSIASGVRRIEALTGETAKKWIEEQVEAESKKLKAEGDKELAKRSRDKRLKEEIARIEQIIKNSKSIGKSKVVIEMIEDMDMEGLRILSDKIRESEKSAVAVLSTALGEKISFIVSVTEDLVSCGVSASDLAKTMAEAIDGSGGGRPNFAQGGGKDAGKLNEAKEKVFDILRGRVK